MTFDFSEQAEKLKQQISPVAFMNYVGGLTKPSMKAGPGMYVCPFCESGEAKNKTGAFKPYPDTKTYYCFACGRTGDIIDLVKHRTNCNESERLQITAKIFNAKLDLGAATPTKEQHQKVTESMPTEKKNYFNEIMVANSKVACLPDDSPPIRYINSRGISRKTAEGKGVGYMDDCQGHGPMITIPTIRLMEDGSKMFSFVGRAIYGEDRQAEQKHNAKNGAAGLFNPAGLYSEAFNYCYVVEGAFDCLSLLELGENALALNSTSGTARLVEYCKDKKPSCLLILALDNDERGQEAQAKLGKILDDMNIQWIDGHTLAGNYKDINERLQNDRAGLVQALERQPKLYPDSMQQYFLNCFDNDMDSFRAAIDTGFKSFNKAIGGGIYSGLYLLGALPSLGKTTLCHQIADNLAKAGEDVIYFSLEQSRLELFTKSLAREGFQDKDRKTHGLLLYTSIDYRRRAAGASDVVKKDGRDYLQKIGDRLSIIEAGPGFSVDSMYKYVKAHIERTGKQPVVIVDYLQIIPAPTGANFSDKEKADYNSAGLRRIVRTCNIPVIAISSFNRANYSSPVTFESFKESGGLEYNADCILGMQLSVINNDDMFLKDDRKNERRQLIEKEKRKSPREVSIIILKNRYGAVGDIVDFNYYPNYDTFQEAAGAEFGVATDEIEDIF